MRTGMILGLLGVLAAASPALADPPTIQAGSLVRVRADNRFGVAKQNDLVPTIGMATSDSITDTETGTTATATNSATYEFAQTATATTFSIRTQQSFSPGSHGNLTEGFIRFTITEPYQYVLSGSYQASGNDADDAYQQRTFLRQALAPFATVFLEDETTRGSTPVLQVNARNDTVGGTHNQVGPLTGVLFPGTYEFSYELEGRDDDLDGSGTSTASGNVTLTLQLPGAGPSAPANLAATVGNNLSVSLFWSAVPGATSYQLEAGNAPGLANIFNGEVGNVTTLQATAAPGVYYVRVRARNGAALGPPSSEVQFTLGSTGPCAPPPTVTGLQASKGNGLVTIQWATSSGATSYRLLAGTAPGLSNAFDGDVGNTLGVQFAISGVPPGTYYVRVAALNACGASGVSTEIVVTVP